MIATPEQFETMKNYERLVLPFKSFKNVFKAGSFYTKLVMILQCVLLTSGPLFFGQIELGLILLAVFGALAFFLGFVSQGYFAHTININAFTYVVMLVILVAALILIV